MQTTIDVMIKNVLIFRTISLILFSIKMKVTLLCTVCQFHRCRLHFFFFDFLLLPLRF